MPRSPVVCTSSLPWRGLQTSRHHLARCLAREREILYVDPPSSAGRARPRLRSALEHVDERIWVLTPPSHLPYGPPGLFPVTTPINQRAYARAVQRAVKHLGWRRPVLWNASVVYLAPLVADAIEPSVHLFHLTDSLWDYPWYRSEYERFLRRIMVSADFALASSEALVERMRPYGRPVHHLPHGVDASAFEPAARRSLPAPAAVAEAARPRFGFVGNIEARLDVDLVCRMAAQDGSVTLVGPVSLPSGDVERLRSAGCRIEPEVTYDEVPAWLGAFDVALLPYRRTELVLRSRPLKLLEYLAAGLPVISPDIPAAAALAPLVDTTGSTDEFVVRAAALGRAVLAGDDAARRPARVERAKSESWEERAESLNHLLSEAEETT